jgi:hypothetical protein
MADVFLRTSLAASVHIEHSARCLVRRDLPTQIRLRKTKNPQTMDFSRQDEFPDLTLVTKSSITPKPNCFYQFPRLCILDVYVMRLNSSHSVPGNPWRCQRRLSTQLSAIFAPNSHKIRSSSPITERSSFVTNSFWLVLFLPHLRHWEVIF